MIGDREADRSTDRGAVWFGHGVELAWLMERLAEDFEGRGPATGRYFANLLLKVLALEYDPQPPRPQLEPPPTVRPASPPGTEPGS